MQQAHGNGNGHGNSLHIEARRHPYDYGPYRAAVRQWEKALGREAPPPVDGGHLSAHFVEWMMGLPEGWVTSHDIAWSKQLHALGNGVVPQQAALALSLLTTPSSETPSDTKPVASPTWG